MNINIKVKGIELTPAINDYVFAKVNSLGRFITAEENSIMAVVEIGKTTNHHKLGDYFRSEINLDFPGYSFRTEAEESDLYVAIDISKDSMVEEIKNANKKKNTLFRRGGRIIKRLIRGFNR